MELNIIPLTEHDYDAVLVKWWKDWGWTPPQQDFLPDNGKGGLMVLDGKTPVCAGFMYATNSKVAWVDWIISNKKYKDKEKRKQALILLIETLTNVCKKSGFVYAYALIKNKSLIDTYKELGYIKGDEYNSEMIKAL
tara:strand:- start:1847 stop:2257 length:411 start_codon:yes stop_codon:yes gene_type:complete